LALFFTLKKRANQNQDSYHATELAGNLSSGLFRPVTSERGQKPLDPRACCFGSYFFGSSVFHNAFFRSSFFDSAFFTAPFVAAHYSTAPVLVAPFSGAQFLTAPVWRLSFLTAPFLHSSSCFDSVFLECKLIRSHTVNCRF